MPAVAKFVINFSVSSLQQPYHLFPGKYLHIGVGVEAPVEGQGQVVVLLVVLGDCEDEESGC